MYTVAGCCTGRLHPHHFPQGHELHPTALTDNTSTAIKINSFFIAFPAPLLKEWLDSTGRRTPAILRHLKRRANRMGPAGAESARSAGGTLPGLRKREDLTPPGPKL
jgi:hypothetical protein